MHQSVLSWVIQICICHYFIWIRAILFGMSMAIRLTSLHRLSNSLSHHQRPGLETRQTDSFKLATLVNRSLYGIVHRISVLSSLNKFGVIRVAKTIADTSNPTNIVSQFLAYIPHLVQENLVFQIPIFGIIFLTVVDPYHPLKHSSCTTLPI